MNGKIELILYQEGRAPVAVSNPAPWLIENSHGPIVVFLDGIGNCDVRNVVSGATCSLDSVNFDKTFNHRW